MVLQWCEYDAATGNDHGYTVYRAGSSSSRTWHRSSGHDGKTAKSNGCWPFPGSKWAMRSADSPRLTGLTPGSRRNVMPGKIVKEWVNLRKTQGLQQTKVEVHPIRNVDLKWPVIINQHVTCAPFGNHWVGFKVSSQEHAWPILFHFWLWP